MTVRATKRRAKRIWVIDISYTAADGRSARYRRDSKSPTRAGAVSEERRILETIARIGSPVEKPPEPAAKKVTYAELVEEYRRDFMPAQLKVSTRRGYSEVLDEHLLPTFGSRQVSKIDGRAAHALDTDLADHAWALAKTDPVALCQRGPARDRVFPPRSSQKSDVTRRSARVV